MRIYLIGPEALAEDVFMLVDEIDADLTKVVWSYNGNYASSRWPRGYQNRPRQVQRVILERILNRPLERNERVDHINQNKLDNRRENLRLATHQQNKRNVSKPAGRKGTKPTSVYKGVSWDKARQLWISRIKTDNRQINLGRFTDEVEAARAYDAAARKYFGEFACCNFPDSNHPDTLTRDSINGDFVQLTTTEMVELLNRPMLNAEPLMFTDQP